jgi:hypothetical protein
MFTQQTKKDIGRSTPGIVQADNGDTTNANAEASGKRITSRHPE